MFKMNYVLFRENEIEFKAFFWVKSKIIKYENIDKLIYTKWSFKNYFKNFNKTENIPGTLTIYFKKKSLINYKYNIYYRHKNLDTIPTKYKKILTINEII